MFTIVPKSTKTNNKSAYFDQQTTTMAPLVCPFRLLFEQAQSVSTRSSLLLNTNDKHFFIKTVQTGTKKSVINISKLQEKKAVEHCDLALLLQRNQ